MSILTSAISASCSFYSYALFGSNSLLLHNSIHTHNPLLYSGSFDNELKQGKGKHVWANKDVYEGDFVGGKKEGRGKKLYFNSDDYYDGEWKDDKKHGQGVFAYNGNK